MAAAVRDEFRGDDERVVDPERDAPAGQRVVSDAAGNPYRPGLLVEAPRPAWPGRCLLRGGWLVPVLGGYETEFIPGQLQTEDYARAVYNASLMTEPEEVDKRVALRMARQERLTNHDAPQLWVVINEAVIRRVIGGPQTMQAQLTHLIDATHLPNITLQVLPFSVGAHPAMTGAFHILGFPERADHDVVYVEYHTGTLYLEKTAEVERYTLMYDHMRAAALHPDDSKALIAQAATELSRQTEP